MSHKTTCQSMQVITQLNAEPGQCKAVAIGNFDGVHRGHQQLLQLTKQLADKSETNDEATGETTSEAGPSGVISFAPLPLEVLRPGSMPGRIGSDAMRCTWLAQYGIQKAWLLPFDKAFSQWSAEAFVETLLVNKLAVQHVVVGADFRYGYQRSGNLETLQAAGKVHGFEVHCITAVNDTSEQRISSTAIRAALQVGDMQTVERLLGRRYEISGKVITGQRLGRELGYPTANIDVGQWNCLLTGVYVVRARVRSVLAYCDDIAHNRNLALQINLDSDEGEWIDGVASCGFRPTINDEQQAEQLAEENAGSGSEISPNQPMPDHLLEVHLFDFNEDLYNQCLQVEIVHKLREELKFDDIDQLIEQMHIDAQQAKDRLKNTP